MKRKIFLNISFVAAITVISASLLLVLIFYNFHLSREKASLKDHAHIMANSLEILEFKDMDRLTKTENPNLRTTIINKNGKVIFDSTINPNQMENHLDRIEIKTALKDGSGESIRYSTTLDKDTYYYAVLLSNNWVLRVSRQTDNILSVFMKILPSIFLTLPLILILSFFISSLLTKNILKPIENTTSNMEKIITGDSFDEVEIYDELIPFIKTVSQQSEEIKLNIKTLEEKADIMDTITSNMKEGLILVDEDKNILSTNISGIRLFNGNEDNSYYGNNFIQLCRDIEVNEALQNVINYKKEIDLMIESNEKYLNVFLNPIISNDSILGAVILIVDSTERHKAHLIRKEFSANVSHELMTPLTSINGYAEMIESGIAKGDDIIKFASIIRNEGARLLDLIDSIIRLSKLEETEKNKDLLPIDIYNIAKTVSQNLITGAEDKDIDLKVHGEKTIINGNKIMIEELLFNLIENSIKYTNPGGKIDITIDKDKDYSYIKVSDTGIGIPKESQNRIFERFYIVDKSRSKKTQSTGLGLSIVKHIVEYHNGDIELISEEGKGTIVTVKF